MKAATADLSGLVGTFAISIHAAREGGDFGALCGIPRSSISIHAAREGGDQVVFEIRNHGPLFQSTPPVKAATMNRVLQELNF